MRLHMTSGFLVVGLGLGGLALVGLRGDVLGDAVSTQYSPPPPPPPSREINLKTPEVRRRAIAPEELPRWDEVASAERRTYLEGRFFAAVAVIEAGGSAARHVLVAQAALTAMRPELYPSAEGRELHRRYEQRLSRAVGEEVVR